MDDSNNQTETQKPLLTPEEARILASLIEKQLTTPQYYPLTPKALTAACNQKSNREPVMTLSEGEVRHIANLLADRDLVRVDSGDRTYRISHRAKRYFELDQEGLAVLTVLILRYPQTLNDIQRRTARMVDFQDTDEVQLVLEDLIERDPPFVVLLPKGSGRREDRYGHTLCGEIEVLAPEKPVSVTSDQHNDRLGALEQRIDDLENKLDQLIQRIDAPRE